MKHICMLISVVWVSVVLLCSPCSALTVSLVWDANTESTLAGYKVYYKADSIALPFDGTGAVEGTSPVDAHNQTTATVSGLDPNRAYYFAVTAYDTSGFESSYSNIVTILESVPPTSAVTAPSNSATVSGTVSVTASASDNVGVTKVEFYANSILQVTDTASPYVYSWNTSSLASGAYALMTKAYDAAGNVGQSSTVNVAVVNDTTAPVVSLTAPGNGSTVANTVVVTASASDNIGVSKVEFYINGSLLSAGNVSPYTFNWNTTSGANGSYTLMARAYDNAGNTTQSANVTVAVNNYMSSPPDSTAPVVSIFTLPATSTSLSLGITSLTATDAVGVSGYLITESATKPAAAGIGWSATAPTSFTFSAAGNRTAYAWAKDSAGNVSASRSAAVAITLPDVTAPTVSAFTLPTTATSLTVAISNLTASDSVGVSGYLITESATKPAATATGWSTTAQTSFTFSSAGSRTAYAWAKDTAGNVSASRSATVTITLPASTDYTISDALLALQIGSGQVTPTAGQVTRLDVAPVVNGISMPNGEVNTGDAIVLLSRIVGTPAM